MKKRLIKVSIIFFGMMIICTIVSRIANNFLKAKVEYTVAQSQSLSYKLELNGKVQALKYVPVTSENGELISEIYVEKGEKVTKDQALFQIDLEKLNEHIVAIQNDINKKEASYETAITNENVRNDEYNKKVERSNQDLVTARENGQIKMDAAYNDYCNAVDLYNEYVECPEKMPEMTEEDLRISIEEKETAYNTVVMEVEQNIVEQERKVEDANTPPEQTSESKTLEIEIEEKNRELEKLKKLLEKNGQVFSPIDGIIKKINGAIGGLIVEGNPVILIADVTKGEKVIFDVDEDDEDFVTSQNQATIQGTNINGEQTKIGDIGINIASKETETDSSDDLNDNNTKITVTFPENTLIYGSQATIVLESKSQEYNNCLPLNALRQDNNGQYFILYIDEKETILGKENVAVKLPVTIIEKNSQYAAVNESISKDYKIITESSKEISENSRVSISGEK